MNRSATSLERMRILKDLWQVGGNGLSGPSDAAVYLARFGHEAALIDAGCGDGHALLMDNISRCLPAGCRVAFVLLTHCHYDHTGGAEALRRDLGCTIIAHSLDAVFLERGDSQTTAASWYGADMPPLKIDRSLTLNETRIPVGDGLIIAHHCPGHSPGSVVYTAQMASSRVLFGQDIHGPLHAMLRSNSIDYQASLKRLLLMESDLLCEGHFGVIRGSEAVRRFIQSYLP